MDHLQFKSSQTAAVYVADGLDEPTLEAFEMHMLDCNECLEDVEAWRAIKNNMPRSKTRPALVPAAMVANGHAAASWRLAASLVVGGLLGATGGWFGHSAEAPNLDSTQTVVFNVPPTARGAEECTNLRLAPDTQFAVLRVPGVARGQHVVLVDANKQELPAHSYTSRVQPDGSHLVRIEARLLEGRALNLQAKAPDGFDEPLGCVTGEVASNP
jgi:hypothetical protein